MLKYMQLLFMNKFSNPDELKTSEGKTGDNKETNQVDDKSEKVEEVEDGGGERNPQEVIHKNSTQEADVVSKTDTNTVKDDTAIDKDVHADTNNSNPDDGANESKEKDSVAKDDAQKSSESKDNENPNTSKNSTEAKEPSKRRFARDVKKSSESDSRKMARSLLQQKKKPAAVRQRGPDKSGSKKPENQEHSKQRGGQDGEPVAEETEEYCLALCIDLYLYSGRGMHPVVLYSSVFSIIIEYQ